MENIDVKKLTAGYEAMTGIALAECRFTTEMVGGQPADEAAIKTFCEFHLKLTGQELLDAVKRIQNEEIDKTQPLDEIKEKESYGVNVIRRDSFGSWIGTWMPKACIKAAASRIGIFTTKRGSKGDLSEMARVLPTGFSVKNHEFRDRIHIYTAGGSHPETFFREFMGSVSSPSGRVSIKHHSECAPVGTMFSFELRVPPVKIKHKDIIDIFSVIGEIGIGSVKALERGKFELVSLQVDGF